MKDMKGYLPEQLLLRHVGRDEKQTGNVHAMLKKSTLRSGSCLC